jgi:hypothetical protein
VSKIDVVRISLAEHSIQSWPEEDKYFYSYVSSVLKGTHAANKLFRSAWDRRHPAGFTEVMNEQVYVPSTRICISCADRDSPISHFVSRTSSLIRSVEYHQLDFIRYEASSPGQITCSIGQIRTFFRSGDEVSILVCRLGRESDRIGPGHFAEVWHFVHRAFISLLTVTYLPLT